MARQITPIRPKIHVLRARALVGIAGLAAPLALAGCAAGDVSAYPSLARRPIEQQGGTAPGGPAATNPASTAAGTAPAATSTTHLEAIRALGRDADRGESAFRAALQAGLPAIRAGRGATAGGEAWAMAQQALSRVDAARAPSSFALAELDQMGRQLGDDAALAAALAAEQARVGAMVNAQGEAIHALADSI